MIIGHITSFSLSLAFTDSPRSVNVTVNSNMSFHCAGQGVSALWRINGSFINSDPPYYITYPSESNGVRTRLLISNISLDFNNTIIDCILEKENGVLSVSPSAVLRVQGNAYMYPCITIYSILLYI